MTRRKATATDARSLRVFDPPDRKEFDADVAAAFGIAFVDWNGERGFVSVNVNPYTGDDLHDGDVVWLARPRNKTRPTIAHGVKVGEYLFSHATVSARFKVAQVATGVVGIVWVELAHDDGAAITSTALPVDRLLRAVIQAYGIVGTTYPPGSKYAVNGRTRTARDFVTVRESWSRDVAAKHAREIEGRTARGGMFSDAVLRKAMTAYMAVEHGDRLDAMVKATGYSESACKKMPARFKVRFADEWQQWENSQKGKTK